jgi:hypothetical protein
MERSYDIVVLGAVGSVLGDPKTTLRRLAETIRPGGYIVLDDGYAMDAAESELLTRQGWLDLLDTCGFQLLEDIPITNEELARICELQLSVIAKRVKELSDTYPDQAPMFQRYLHLQQQECAELSDTIQGVTMMIQ